MGIFLPKLKYWFYIEYRQLFQSSNRNESSEHNFIQPEIHILYRHRHSSKIFKSRRSIRGRIAQQKNTDKHRNHFGDSTKSDFFRYDFRNYGQVGRFSKYRVEVD